MLAKESIKKFLKPDRRKVILSLVICIFVVYVDSSGRSCYSGRGIICLSFQEILSKFPFLLICYLVSCLIVFVWTKFVITKIEKIKNFLKPDKKKILFFLLFFVFSAFYVYKHECPPHWICEGGDTFLQGLPLPFNGWSEIYGKENSRLLFPLLFFDLIFWYLISCFLISAWDKIRKKPAA